MQPDSLIETVLRIGREVWDSLPEDEREKYPQSGGPFQQQVVERVLAAVPHKSIENDRNMFVLLEAASNFFSPDGEAEAAPCAALDFAAWTFQSRGLKSEAADAIGALARVSALVEDMEGDVISDEEILPVLRLIREDVRALVNGDMPSEAPRVPYSIAAE